MSDCGPIFGAIGIEERLEELTKVLTDVSKELNTIALELGVIRGILEKKGE
jgi:hypothetical protein